MSTIFSTVTGVPVDSDVPAVAEVLVVVGFSAVATNVDTSEKCVVADKKFLDGIIATGKTLFRIKKLREFSKQQMSLTL